MGAVAVLKVGSTTTVLLAAKSLENPIKNWSTTMNLMSSDRDRLLKTVLDQAHWELQALGSPPTLVAGGEVLRRFPSLVAIIRAFGWPLWVPSGIEEGQIAWLGVKSKYPAARWVVDVGGGSTEFISSQNIFSIPVGVASANRLKEVVWPPMDAARPILIGGTAEIVAQSAGSPIISRERFRELKGMVSKFGDLPGVVLDPARQVLVPGALMLLDSLWSHYRWESVQVASRGFTAGLWLVASLGRGGSQVAHGA